jgi:methylated-DNA-protein-cysteine methyltransferase related protein
MIRLPPKSIKREVIDLVCRIPKGNVITYGGVAFYIGGIARTIGWIMATLSEEEMLTVPWHRVIGANGTIPALKYGLRGDEQIRRLEEEGFVWQKNHLVVHQEQWYTEEPI